MDNVRSSSSASGESMMYRNTLVLSPARLMDKLVEVGQSSSGAHCGRFRGRMGAAGSPERRERKSTWVQTMPEHQHDDSLSDIANTEASDVGDAAAAVITATVQLQREGSSLGISFIGGSDTSLGSIQIQKILPGGLADRDDRLRPGDVILQVNDVDLTSATHSEAKLALSDTKESQCRVTLQRGSSDSCVQVRLSLPAACPPALLRIRLGRGFNDSNCRLGIKLVYRSRYPSGLFVDSLMPGSPAQRDGRLKPGDRVLELNGYDVSGRWGNPELWDARMLGTFAGPTISLLIMRHENSHS